MADSVATPSVFKHPLGVDTTNRTLILRGTIGLTAGHYPVGGFPISWATSTNANAGSSASGQGYQEINSTYVGVNKDSVKGNVTLLPTEVLVWSAANPPSGYVYTIDRSVGNLHIFVSDNTSAVSGPLIEFGGQLTGTMLSDSIQFCAVFPKSV